MDDTRETTSSETSRDLTPANAVGLAADAALARVDGLPLVEHPDVYQEIHAGLRSALADIDDA